MHVCGVAAATSAAGERQMTARRRRRADCPVCGRNVALTPSRVIRRHINPGGYHCAASGTMTAADTHRADLKRLNELIWAYPEQARKMVARLPGGEVAGEGDAEAVGA